MLQGQNVKIVLELFLTYQNGFGNWTSVILNNNAILLKVVKIALVIKRSNRWLVSSTFTIHRPKNGCSIHRILTHRAATTKAYFADLQKKTYFQTS